MGIAAVPFPGKWGMCWLSQAALSVSAFATCVLIVVTVGIKWIENEVKQSSKFRYECVYGLFVCFLAPICLAVIFISSLANVLGFIHM